MPEHLLESLKSEMLTRMVIVCDVLLYKVMFEERIVDAHFTKVSSFQFDELMI